MLHKFIVSILFLISVPAVFACSCAQPPTVNISYEHSEVVAIVRFVNVKEGEVVDGKTEILGASAVVQKAYKGSVKVGDTLFFDNSGLTSCSIFIGKDDLGLELLIYTKRPEDGVSGSWSYSMCGRTRPTNRAGDDLLYLDNIERARARSRISGILSYSERSRTEESRDIFRKLEGYRVKVTGNGKIYEAITDKNGAYEIYDLQQGVYTIEPQLNPLWTKPEIVQSIDYGAEKELKEEYLRLQKISPKVSGNLFSKSFPVVMLISGRQAGVNFSYGPRNSIKGTVIGQDGKPLQTISLDLIPSEGKPNPWLLMSENTNVAGAFEFENVPPGKYYIVANNYDIVSSKEPYPRTFYPGTTDVKDAIPVEIGLGEAKSGFRFKMPKFAETVTLSGRMVFSDGMPVLDEGVAFDTISETRDRRGYSDGNTDMRGRFRLTVLKGLNGKIFPSMIVYPRKYVNCPQMDKLFTSSGFKAERIQTPEINVEASHNISGLVIKLPFKSCKKAK